MADEYSILIPEVASAVFSVNPANINSKTVLAVTVTEETVYLEPYYYYCGDLFAGEV